MCDVQEDTESTEMSGVEWVASIEAGDDGTIHIGVKQGADGKWRVFFDNPDVVTNPAANCFDTRSEAKDAIDASYGRSDAGIWGFEWLSE